MVASLATLFPGAGVAKSTVGDSIVFLHLRVVDSTVRLIRVEVRPGTLKQPRSLQAKPGEIRLEVADGQGHLLHEGLMPDPTHVVYEYVDDQGELRQRLVVKDSADAVVRIPYDVRAWSVQFQQVPDVADGQASSREKITDWGRFRLDLKAVRDDR